MTAEAIFDHDDNGQQGVGSDFNHRRHGMNLCFLFSRLFHEVVMNRRRKMAEEKEECSGMSIDIPQARKRKTNVC